MKKYLTKEYLKRNLIMLFSVCMMGVCVQFLNLTKLGPDPCSSLNYGVSAKLGMSFGTYQFLFNVVLFLIVVVQDKSLFGTGSLGNMILVGYAADFTGWVLQVTGLLPKLQENMSAGLAVGIMIPALAVFLVVAALYMNCGLGTAPYDAIPFLVHKKLEMARKKKIPFRFVRMAFDGIVTLAAFLIGGGIGIVTVLMIFLLGPAVDGVSRVVEKSGIFTE
ncbi:MAG: hypothetical protein J6A77_06860 [Lachnospiraceae bacterium]|nr:hypothetical protein [Lachnospiraceae bacterium]